MGRRIAQAARTVRVGLGVVHSVLAFRVAQLTARARHDTRRSRTRGDVYDARVSERGGELIEIGPDQVEQHRQAGWTLIDVRTDAEWAQGRIDGSVHLPLDQLIARLDEVADRVICVCAVGGRSAQAATYLTAQGCDAINLAGGVQAWAASGRALAR